MPNEETQPTCEAGKLPGGIHTVPISEGDTVGDVMVAAAQMSKAGGAGTGFDVQTYDEGTETLSWISNKPANSAEETVDWSDPAIQNESYFISEPVAGNDS